MDLYIVVTRPFEINKIKKMKSGFALSPVVYSSDSAIPGLTLNKTNRVTLD